jgi:hypothetical protein
MELMLNENFWDYTYFKEKGWFESDYYYPTQLNSLKKLVGKFFDFSFNRIYGKGNTGKQGEPVQIADKF